MSAEYPILAPTVEGEEDELDRSLRPRRLDEFVGQERIKEQLAIALEATRSRGEALDHLLLIGPPGLGKTSLAFIVREELGVDFRSAAGPALERKGDVAAILTSLGSATSSSSTRSTGSAARSRRSSTRRSRTSGSTSSSARARRRGPSRSTCRRSR